MNPASMSRANDADPGEAARGPGRRVDPGAGPARELERRQRLLDETQEQRLAGRRSRRSPARPESAAPRHEERPVVAASGPPRGRTLRGTSRPGSGRRARPRCSGGSARTGGAARGRIAQAPGCPRRSPSRRAPPRWPIPRRRPRRGRSGVMPVPTDRPRAAPPPTGDRLEPEDLLHLALVEVEGFDHIDRHVDVVPVAAGVEQDLEREPEPGPDHREVPRPAIQAPQPDGDHERDHREDRRQVVEIAERLEQHRGARSRARLRDPGHGCEAERSEDQVDQREDDDTERSSPTTWLSGRAGAAFDYGQSVSSGPLGRCWVVDVARATKCGAYTPPARPRPAPARMSGAFWSAGAPLGTVHLDERAEVVRAVAG